MIPIKSSKSKKWSPVFSTRYKILQSRLESEQLMSLKRKKKRKKRREANLNQFNKGLKSLIWDISEIVRKNLMRILLLLLKTSRKKNKNDFLQNYFAEWIDFYIITNDQSACLQGEAYERELRYKGISTILLLRPRVNEISSDKILSCYTIFACYSRIALLLVEIMA